MSGEERYDAIVVGARITGSAIALALARNGWRVALIEQRPRPLTDTLSVPITYPRALKRFQTLGLWPAIEALAPTLKFQRSVRMRLTPDLVVSGATQPYAGFDYSYILPRDRFDDTLLGYALDQEPDRITFYEAHIVERLLRDNDEVVTGVGVRATGMARGAAKPGETRELLAPLTIGADGRASRVARLVSAPQYWKRKSATTLFYIHCAGIDWTDLADIMFMAGERQRLIVMSEIGSGQQVISTFFPVTQFDEFRRDPLGQMRASWEAAPELRGRMDHWEPLGKVMGLSPQPGYFRPGGGAGWALLGDAAHFKDPAAGQGFHDALFTIERFLATLDELTGGKPLTAEDAYLRWPVAAERMTRARDRALLPMYLFTYAFAEALTRPPGALQRALLHTLARDPRAAQTFLGVPSGATSVGAFLAAVPGYIARGLLPAFSPAAHVSGE